MLVEIDKSYILKRVLLKNQGFEKDPSIVGFLSL